MALPLAAFLAVWFWPASQGRSPFAVVISQAQAAPIRPETTDRLSADFGICRGPVRRNCVVDGDTFWFRGDKIRIADINTPEVSQPQCPREAALGERATERLVQLLNSGPFTLEAINRDSDQYGRQLRIVTRGGESIGATLEAEGLAEHWKGYRSSWC